MFKDKHTSIFLRKTGAIVFAPFQIFCNAREKCLRTAYCMQREVFSFECSLVQTL